MIELAAGFATLSLFLAWRLHVANKRLHLADVVLTELMSGRMVAKKTKEGFMLEIKEAHDD